MRPVLSEAVLLIWEGGVFAVMYRGQRISVVIPCFNEEAGITKVLSQMPAFVDETIVVDNGSTDQTAYVAQRGGAIVVSEKRRGYGRAFQAGFAYARGDILVTLDGDNSYPPADIETLLFHMASGQYDFVVGTRYPLKDGRVQPLLNRIGNRLISLLVCLLFDLNLRDSQSGMMVLRRSTLPVIGRVSDGMSFSQEVKINAYQASSLRCSEKSITYRYRTGRSKFRLVDGLGNLVGLWCFYLRKRRARCSGMNHT